MKKFISLLVNRHIFSFRYLLVLVIIIWVTFLYPRRSFHYDYALGQPWKYDDLYAPFSYTIKKMPAQIKREEDELYKTLHTYYAVTNTMADSVFAHLVVNLNKDGVFSNLKINQRDSTNYLRTSQRILTNLYQRGIYEQAPADFNKPDSVLLIYVPQIGPDGVKRYRKVEPNRNYYKRNNACAYISEQQAANMPDSVGQQLRNRMCGLLIPNLTVDSVVTRKMHDEALAGITEGAGYKEKGELIVVQGQIVSEQILRELESLRQKYEQIDTDRRGHNSGWLKTYETDIGYFLVTFMLFALLVLSLRIFNERVFKYARELTFLLLTIVMFVYVLLYVYYLVEGNTGHPALYVLPFCFPVILISNFFGRMVAYFSHVVLLFLAGFMAPLGFDFLFVQFIAGLVAITVNERIYYWNDFIIAAALIFVTYCTCYTGVSLMRQTFEPPANFQVLGWLAINSLINLAAYQLLPIFEKLFGFVSSLTLLQLSDLNRGLLKKLYNKAPGTFSHSLNVANLAEAAAREIGANPLKAKTGALYHDIGKMYKPIYFVENQPKDINPHEDLAPEESAQIIVEHVTEGVAIARRHKLPNLIIDFIRTHHGTTRVEYFYQKQLGMGTDRDDDRFFRYPGPVPYSHETAIVMLADSVEAASRALKSPDEEEINKLVERLIDEKIQEDQLVNCPLSFKDLVQIKRVFKKQLRSIHHVRISYPVLNQPAEEINSL